MHKYQYVNPKSVKFRLMIEEERYWQRVNAAFSGVMILFLVWMFLWI